jgi:hypothetical protein
MPATVIVLPLTKVTLLVCVSVTVVPSPEAPVTAIVEAVLLAEIRKLSASITSRTI